MPNTSSTSGRPRQQLTFYDALSIIIGIVIGAGIYETTPLIAKSMAQPVWLIGIWITGGIISLIGALCYAELSTTYPEEGGDYIFLTRAYGGKTGFLFAWAGFWLIKPANIGAIAFIFARYAQQVLPLQLDGNEFIAYAVAAVVLLTIFNINGVQTGKWIQNLLTLVKVMGLLMITVIGLLFVVPVSNTTGQVSTSQDTDIYLAMILVLFTYGGWSSISYVAAEVIEPQKNILRSLITGTCLVTLIYVVINFAFLHALGIHGMMNSQSIASDVIRLSFGEPGAMVISVLICITCLGNINGMIFTNARVYYAMGQEHQLYSWLGHWNGKLDSPVRSLTLQAIITLALVILMGANEGAFERLVLFSAPLHWFFFLMVAIALFILRRKKTVTKGSYKVPFYPWLPIVFCLSTGFLLFASLSYAYSQRHPEAYVIIAVMLIGIVASLYDPPVTENK
jgi:APA family basic amino acid/polyamine antiporter